MTLWDAMGQCACTGACRTERGCPADPMKGEELRRNLREAFDQVNSLRLKTAIWSAYKALEKAS